MKVHHGLDEFSTLNCAVATTGTFDGVHQGHQKILDQVVAKAKSVGGESVLLTFEPHPRLVLQPDTDLELLSSMEEKIQLLEATGIDHLIIHPFTKEFSRTPSLDFVREILVNTIGVKFFVIGYDHHFGRNREGSFEHLKEFSPIYGFEVEEISALDIDQVNVSSTKIRNALKAGEVELAHEYLGHPYSLEGVVIEGRKLGRELGFPTANVNTAFQHKLYPADGVYAGWAVVKGQRFKAMANLGARPTIGSLERKLEVHLFEVEDNLYGQHLTFEVHHKLRDVMEFGTLDALKAQIEKDGQLARERLAQ